MSKLIIIISVIFLSGCVSLSKYDELREDYAVKAAMLIACKELREQEQIIYRGNCNE
jgi:uncharacterized protein YceK